MWRFSEETCLCFRLETWCTCALKSQGWIYRDPEGPLQPPNRDNLSFLLPFLMFLLPGVELDMEESASDDLKTVCKHRALLISAFPPPEGLGQAGL